MRTNIITGIDLAGKAENPTGYAVLKDERIKAGILYTDNQILETITTDKPEIIAIDAPFSLPKSGAFRKADKEMIKNGYHVLPPSLPSMRKLAMRAMKLNKLMVEKRFKTIEVHPTSACQALKIPPKNWRKIQTFLTQIGLEGDLKVRTLAPHEIDAIIAALTAYLYIKKQTDALGDSEEGYIIIPKKQDWRTIQI